MEQALLDRNTASGASQAFNDQRPLEQSQLIISLNLKIDARVKEVHETRADIDEVKTTWQKRLQAQFDKFSATEKNLRAEEQLYRVTKLDLEAREAESLDERQTVKNAKTSHTANLKKYQEIRLRTRNSKSKSEL